jgi:hypothetical protein
MRSFARAVHQVRRPIFLRGGNGIEDGEEQRIPFGVGIGLRGVAKFKPFLWPIDRWPDEQPSGMSTNYAAGYRVAFRASCWAVSNPVYPLFMGGGDNRQQATTAAVRQA